MRAAQKLYEGVDLSGEGAVALITYMRTDSTRVSNEALQAVRGHISATFGAPYLPADPNRYASGKSAQEAHEAIRPTDLSYTPERVELLAGPRRAAPPGHDPPLHADLQPLRRQPDDAGGVGGDERGSTGDARTSPERQRGDIAVGSLQGPGQNPQVRRLPPRAGADRQAGGRHAAVAVGEAATGPARPDGQPALHAAAAALQRGVAHQGLGEGGHRPAQHLCVDHPQDHVGGAPLHRGARPPLPRHGDRQGGDGPAGGALPARHGPEIHQPNGRGAGPDRDCARPSTARC